MPGPLDWTCRCGTVQVRVAEGSGSRLTCYCKHCRVYARMMKAGDTLDASGGSELYQTTPDMISVTAGADKLACLKLSEKGPLRWYAACCDTPLANTLGKPSIPFAGLLLGAVSNPDAAGPTTARVHTGSATAPLSDPSGGLVSASVSIIGRALKARISGRHKTTPFFGADGQPVSAPRIVTQEERRPHFDPSPDA